MKRTSTIAFGLATLLLTTAANAEPPRQEIQAPRTQNVEVARGQDVQAPRGEDKVEAPRGGDVHSPR